MINIQHLEQLITVAKEGTLSRAAEVLLISQPSLTRNMRQLEDDLGVQLFQRSKNKLSLTELVNILFNKQKLCSTMSSNF